MKRFGEELSLKGMLFSDKLRVWWFVLSFVCSGSVADALVWLIILLCVNFVASAISLSKINISKDKEEDEV
jgi:hypothetical protein